MLQRGMCGYSNVNKAEDWKWSQSNGLKNFGGCEKSYRMF